MDGQPSFLRIETSSDQQELRIPSFIEVVREVTHDKNYISYNMAQKDYKMLESDKKMVSERKD